MPVLDVLELSGFVTLGQSMCQQPAQLSAVIITILWWIYPVWCVFNSWHVSSAAADLGVSSTEQAVCWGLHQGSLGCCFLPGDILKLDSMWFWRDIVLISSFHLFHVLHGVSSHLMSAFLGKFCFVCCVLYDGILSCGKSQFVFMFMWHYE